jgi:hypothetical protein
MNMDYCKFKNTLSALRQCADGWDEEVKGNEAQAKQEMIELMIDLLNEEGYGIEQIESESTDCLPTYSKSTGERIS